MTHTVVHTLTTRITKPSIANLRAALSILVHQGAPASSSIRISKGRSEENSSDTYSVVAQWTEQTQ